MNFVELVDFKLESDGDGAKQKAAFLEVKKVISKHNEMGHKLISMTPLTAGEYDYQSTSGAENYGYGYSFTNVIIIVFEGKES